LIGLLVLPLQISAPGGKTLQSRDCLQLTEHGHSLSCVRPTPHSPLPAPRAPRPASNVQRPTSNVQRRYLHTAKIAPDTTSATRLYPESIAQRAFGLDEKSAEP
jgi:hypothetical protein